eukprot:9606527-Prorocentrum_lima.AAC.1
MGTDVMQLAAGSKPKASPGLAKKLRVVPPPGPGSVCGGAVPALARTHALPAVPSGSRHQSRLPHMLQK